DLAEYINTPSWNHPAFYNNDNEDYTIAITPDFLIMNSLSMGDEHLCTISETKLDELIKSSVENLVLNPRESDGLSDIGKEPNSENSDDVIESFSPSPIPVEGSDSLMEEIDIFLTPDDSIPPGIENDDYGFEGGIIFLEELLSNDSPSLSDNESFHFDVPSSPRPPVKPSDDGIYFKPDTRVLTVKVVGDIFEHYVHLPRLLPTQPTLALNEEKSPHLLSHRGFKASQLIFDFSKSLMMIYRGDSPTLDVSYLHFYPP
nr:hypothetical protein [Tanacetum cinerariifolium]GEZ99399.1 hypothetical protein [Tanacetum cinerariifolium]